MPGKCVTSYFSVGLGSKRCKWYSLGYSHQRRGYWSEITLKIFPWLPDCENEKTIPQNGNLRLKAVILNGTAVDFHGYGRLPKGSGRHDSVQGCLCLGKQCSLQWWVRSRKICDNLPWCGSLGPWCHHVTWLWWWSCCSVVFLGLAVDESTECVRTETTRRVFFRKKKKVSTRCTTNRMTVKHEGDHDENRAHVLLLTLRDTVPLSLVSQVTS